MTHHAGASDEHALGEIKIRRTPVTINLYDSRLAHTATPGIKVEDGKVKITSRFSIPESGEELSSLPGLDVQPSGQETYNYMVPYRVVGEPE
ncbi:predicted protein [Chaetomium globosum CBS 148.51]|uniref:Uncharacterized protein n=1 Tax=Chaetomium globosum (strain ATCC 6205 / CBS 148.51 / DSM 1962 / NBRC 6347 / NRRL 1970) TaxID=306901 RepID=Q2H2X5_CHAGB|nr:uncharacterized protein CHGG_03871 [Chaetomium globosum CBS 148.51]EAQ87252.1 predicted protein [Chaetomium globosum CBS 148.51]